MDRAEVVRKLRSLRSLERRLRGGTAPLFDEYFALQEGEPARYPLLTLSILDHESRAHAFEEYLTALFGGDEARAEPHPSSNAAYTRLATALGLSPDSSPQAVRRGFRRAMLEYHPDQGGDNSLAAELIELYRLAFE